MLDRDACIAALALAGYEPVLTPGGAPMFWNHAKRCVIYIGYASPTQREVYCWHIDGDEPMDLLNYPSGFNDQELRWLAAAAHRLEPNETMLCVSENSI